LGVAGAWRLKTLEVFTFFRSRETALKKQTISVHQLSLVGVLLIALSAVFPWMHTTVLGKTWRFGPLYTPEFRIASILVLVLIVVTSALLLLNDLPVVYLVVPAQLWAFFSACCWLAGIGLHSLLPSSLIPDGVVPAAHFSMFFAMVGGILISAVSIFESTYDAKELQLPILGTSGTFLTVGLVLVARDISWVKAEVDLADWKLGADSIPFLGGTIGVIGLVITICLIVGLIWQIKWVFVASAVAGGILIAIGLISFAVTSLMKRGVKVTIEALGGGQVEQITFGYGPLVLILAGFCTVAMSLYGFLAKGTSMRIEDTIVDVSSTRLL